MIRSRYILPAVMALSLASASPAVAASKHCSTGYKQGTIDRAAKCLRVHQLCERAYASQYKRYGFNCVRRDGRYELVPR